MKIFTLALSAALFATGCTPLWVSEVSGTDLNPSVPSGPAGDRVAAPLFIVMESESLAAQQIDLGLAQAIRVEDLSPFIRRDVRAVFSQFFEDVQVVENEAALPDAPHVAVRLRIDGLEVQRYASQTAIGSIGHRRVAARWTVDVQPTFGATAWSFDTESVGSVPLVHVKDAPQVVESVLSAALSDLRRALADRPGLDAV